MNRVALTQQRLQTVLHYDQASEQFTWLVSPRYGIYPGSVAGDKERGTIQVDGVSYHKDRLVKLYLEGVLPPPQVPPHKQVEEARIRVIVAKELGNLLLPCLTAAHPEFALALQADLAAHANSLGFDELYAPKPKEKPLTPEQVAAAIVEARLTDTLADYKSAIITAQLLAELADVEYSSKSKLTWAATLRNAGWVKLGSTLLTRHGYCSIYCRREDAGIWATKAAVEMRAGLPEGVYVGYNNRPT